MDSPLSSPQSSRSGDCLWTQRKRRKRARDLLVGSSKGQEERQVSVSMSGESLLPQGSPLDVEAILASPERREVTFSFSFHNLSVSGRTVNVHLVLKFKYDEQLIEEVFGAEKPRKAVEKRYGDFHRLFPYCIFNSIGEQPVSWSYQNKDGKVYERVELFVTLTMVKYMRYFPFELTLLPLKVGTDGTARTGLINLKPEMTSAGVPNVDFGIFAKATSELCIGSPTKALDNTVICRSFVRNLSRDSLGNVAGVYTRVYTAFFFESPLAENMFKFIILSTMLLNLTVFISFIDFGLQDILGTVLAISLSDIALLFTLPGQMGSSYTAEIVIVTHVVYELLLTFGIGYLRLQEGGHGMHRFIMLANIVATCCTIIFVLREYIAFRRLVGSIKQKFKPLSGQVGSFEEVDQVI